MFLFCIPDYECDCPLPETDRQGSEPVLVPVAALGGRLDLHGHIVPRSLTRPLHPGQVMP